MPKLIHRAAAMALPVVLAGPLLAVLPPQSAQASTRAGAGVSYVALGDSYTAGPFIPARAGSPAGCLRSTRDYPAVVASALGAASFANVSCSGATTADMTGSQPVPGGINPPQFSALSPRTTLVTVGIGGNDIGFGSIVGTCAAESLTDPVGSPCRDHYTSGGTDQLARAVQELAPRIAAVLRRIHRLAPDARVLLVGYPVILPVTGDGCWPEVPIASGDLPYLRGVELELNRMLATEAAANSATFVNTYTDSVGHDACQPPGRAWVEGLIPTAPAEPFHPDQAGEQHMAGQVLAVLSLKASWRHAAAAARSESGAPVSW